MIVKTSGDKDQTAPPNDLKDSDIDHEPLAVSTASEGVDELVVGDFDDPVVFHGPSLKAKESRSSVRDKVDEIVAGAFGNRDSSSALTAHLRPTLFIESTI